MANFVKPLNEWVAKVVVSEVHDFSVQQQKDLGNIYLYRNRFIGSSNFFLCTYLSVFYKAVWTYFQFANLKQTWKSACLFSTWNRNSRNIDLLVQINTWSVWKIYKSISLSVFFTTPGISFIVPSKLRK